MVPYESLYTYAHALAIAGHAVEIGGMSQFGSSNTFSQDAQNTLQRKLKDNFNFRMQKSIWNNISWAVLTGWRSQPSWQRWRWPSQPCRWSSAGWSAHQCHGPSCPPPEQTWWGSERWCRRLLCRTSCCQVSDWDLVCEVELCVQGPKVKKWTSEPR